jgi:hypothetical protein
VHEVRLVFTLAEQAIGWYPDRRKLLVAQRWTGFKGGRHAFVLAMNDVVTGQRAGTPGAVRTSYDEVAAVLRPHVVTEDQARRHLAEQFGRPAKRLCLDTDCGARLPLGWLYCTQCGLPRGGHHTDGAATDAYRIANVVPISSP